MSKLPIISGKKLLRMLLKHGFVALRKKGSHVFVESADGARGTVVPIHGNEDLGTGLLKSILNDLELSVDDLIKMLRGKRS
jgi:predicted RNA binding protein YcfA (HicA-like mRNA interferase family)